MMRLVENMRAEHEAQSNNRFAKADQLPLFAHVLLDYAESS
jgi:hypothetical protein